MTTSVGAGGRHPAAALLRLLVTSAAAPVAIVNGYLVVVTAAAWLEQRRARAARPTARPPTSCIAVLVPAHDEEPIIGSTIDSIVGQEYPHDLFSVHVVADNCSDGTAAVAREHGAHVHERSDSEAPGKGPALGWLVDRLEDLGEPLDAIVILDADTAMAPEFLRAADAAIAGGGSAWQAYYTVRHPELSPSTALRHAALVLRHYVRPLGRTALGGSCGLFGNGMVFRSEVLRERRFSAHLTEDVEFQLELLLQGDIVRFMPDGVVEAEMPSTLDAARTQNERWELGRVQLARRYVPELARRALRPGQEHRAALVDATLDQLVPPLSVLAAATSAVVVGSALVRGGGSSPLSRAAVTLAGSSALGLVVHVFGGLKLARAPRSVYVALLHAPRLVVWKVGLWLRVLLRPDRVSWTRTERNRP